MKDCKKLQNISLIIAKIIQDGVDNNIVYITNNIVQNNDIRKVFKNYNLKDLVLFLISSDFVHRDLLSEFVAGIFEGFYDFYHAKSAKSIIFSRFKQMIFGNNSSLKYQIYDDKDFINKIKKIAADNLALHDKLYDKVIDWQMKCKSLDRIESDNDIEIKLEREFYDSIEELKDDVKELKSKLEENQSQEFLIINLENIFRSLSRYKLIISNSDKFDIKDSGGLNYRIFDLKQEISFLINHKILPELDNKILRDVNNKVHNMLYGHPSPRDIEGSSVTNYGDQSRRRVEVRVL